MSGIITNGVLMSWDEYMKAKSKKIKIKKTTPSEKIIERLSNENGYDFSDQVKIIRTGASRAWRGSGRWSWEIKDPLRRLTLGSDTGIRELLKFKFLIVCYREGGRILGYDELP